MKVLLKNDFFEIIDYYGNDNSGTYLQSDLIEVDLIRIHTGVHFTILSYIIGFFTGLSADNSHKTK